MDELRKRLQIARWIAEDMLGNLDDQGRALLDAWLAESPEHVQEMEKIRGEVVAGKWEVEEVARKGWEDFKRRKRLVLWRRVMKYAAILLLPLAVAAGLWWHDVHSAEEAAPVVEPIVAGKTRAVLELADGKRVDLDEMRHLDLQEKDGTAITLSEDQVLRYDGEASTSGQQQEYYNTLWIPKGGEYSLQLSDGTRVWLNAATRLKYPVAFTGKERRVELEGEAYFEVRKDDRHPFIVSAEGVDVQVYGTSFNINTFVAQGVETVLLEGSVGVRRMDGGEECRIVPGEMAVYDEGDGSLAVKEVDVALYTSWIEGLFKFEEERLEDIMETLSRWYDVEVFFYNDALRDALFTGDLRRYKNIGEHLRMLEMTTNVAFEVKGNTVFVGYRK